MLKRLLMLVLAITVLIGPAHLLAAEAEPAPLLPSLTDSSTYWQALWVVIIFVVLLIVILPDAADQP